MSKYISAARKQRMASGGAMHSTQLCYTAHIKTQQSEIATTISIAAFKVAATLSIAACKGMIPYTQLCYCSLEIDSCELACEVVVEVMLLLVRLTWSLFIYFFLPAAEMFGKSLRRQTALAQLAKVSIDSK